MLKVSHNFGHELIKRVDAVGQKGFEPAFCLAKEAGVKGFTHHRIKELLRNIAGDYPILVPNDVLFQVHCPVVQLSIREGEFVMHVCA